MIRFLVVSFFIFSIALSSSFYGAELSLKERLLKAKSGDYIVAESNKTTTLLCIRSLTSKSVVLEEITIPSKNLKEPPASWAEWIKNKAPGHSSWSMLEVDLETAQIIECYSFSRAAWIQLSTNESLFATLIKLRLNTIRNDERRRIGPPPLSDEKDVRQIWNPPLVFEGKKRERALFDAFQAEWPKDGSELSGKAITLYFDKEIGFPLPFWISVETSHAIGNFRAIDSGRNLPSVYRTLPKRFPQFVGHAKKTEKGLELTVKSPKYFRQFELFVVDVTGKEKQIFPITHSLAQPRQEEGLLTLEIDQDDLVQTLEEDHRYTWLLVPMGHSESYTETTRPFTWTLNQ